MSNHRFILLTVALGVNGFASAHGAPIYKATILHDPAWNPEIAALSLGLGTSARSQVGWFLSGTWSHAVLWRGSFESAVDLNPIGFYGSSAGGSWRNHQVGSGRGPATGGDVHALYWSGTAESAVDIHPTGFLTSEAYGIWHDDVVGIGNGPTTAGLDHALLWDSATESVVDLHPSGFLSSYAGSNWGSTQVGNGTLENNVYHPLLWHGTAASVIDIMPVGFESSRVQDIWENTQVGEGGGPDLSGPFHALKWNGSAESFVDIHPTEFDSSHAYSIWGNLIVGSGDDRAIMWDETDGTVTDLHQLLTDVDPAISFSYAVSVGPDGSIVGFAIGGGTKGVSTIARAVLWTPTPEPTSCALLVCGAIAMALQRKSVLVLTFRT